MRLCCVLGQDYRLHRDEIHSKLIAIMQERMHFHRRKIPQVLEEWLKQGEAPTSEMQPSEFATALVKEVSGNESAETPSD